MPCGLAEVDGQRATVTLEDEDSPHTGSKNVFRGKHTVEEKGDQYVLIFEGTQFVLHRIHASLKSLDPQKSARPPPSDKNSHSSKATSKTRKRKKPITSITAITPFAGVSETSSSAKRSNKTPSSSTPSHRRTNTNAQTQQQMPKKHKQQQAGLFSRQLPEISSSSSEDDGDGDEDENLEEDNRANGSSG
uniref:Transcription elongation factor Eaf N-terminal domain-containing protein n=1 Tax=Lotharella globosa TaxID=91324 RepID=A0A7S3Z9P2_9EUKA